MTTKGRTVVWVLPRPADGRRREVTAEIDAVVLFQRGFAYQVFNQYYQSDQDALSDFMEIHNAWLE
jgi:hypothetical protein